jgi:hypothetical protein
LIFYVVKLHRRNAATNTRIFKILDIDRTLMTRIEQISADKIYPKNLIYHRESALSVFHFGSNNFVAIPIFATKAQNHEEPQSR